MSEVTRNATSLSRQEGRHENQTKHWGDTEAMEIKLKIGALTKFAGLNTKTFVELSKEDEEILHVKEALISNVWPTQRSATTNGSYGYRFCSDELWFKGDLLFRDNQLVPPRKLRQEILKECHRAHPGSSTMKMIVRDRFWWPLMDREIETMVKSCQSCVQVARMDPPNPITCSELPKKPWHTIGMDHHTFGGTEGYIVILVDFYTRYILCYETRTTSASDTIKVLEKVCQTFGKPSVIKSDNGSPFQSKEFEQWCCGESIKLEKSTPDMSRTNGLTERPLQGVNKTLRISEIEGRPWRAALQEYVMMKNSWKHHATGEAPEKLLSGRTCIRWGPPNLAEEPIWDQELRDRDRQSKMKSKWAEDKRTRARISNLEVGDKVLLHHKSMKKTDPTFGSDIWTVIDRQGTRVTIKSEKNQVLVRDTTWVKKFTPLDLGNVEHEQQVKKSGEVQDEVKHVQEPVVENDSVQRPEKDSVQRPEKDSVTIDQVPNEDILQQLNKDVTNDEELPSPPKRPRRACRKDPLNIAR